jgi:hypothetical protein
MLQEIIQKTENPFLDVIYAGAIPPNPSDLLGSERFADLIKELKGALPSSGVGYAAGGPHIPVSGGDETRGYYWLCAALQFQ